LVHDPNDKVATTPPAAWALGELRDALTARGLSVRLRQRLEDVTADEIGIVAAGAAVPSARQILDKAGITVPSGPELVSLVPGQANYRPVVVACGSDTRCLVYGLLELADRVVYAEAPLAALDVRRAVVERPANPIRSVTRLFASDVEDKSWFGDRSF